ncbi:MAG: glycosyltransferase family 39 protein [Bryobacteraceae bacterium]|nr:glycosyltransferase family 39 protein [Bryobacteraceae bacterium]
MRAAIRSAWAKIVLKRYVLTLLVLLLAVAGLQVSSAAYRGGFGSQPDEAAHYVTALMVRDYLADGFPQDPLSFAKQYYLHYPRVAFGLWPPLFHLLSGLWMLVFGVDRTTVLMLQAAITALWGMLFFYFAHRNIGFRQAAVSAVILVTLPASQRSTMSVMLDVPLAVLMLLAMMCYARYLQSEAMKDAVRFGLLASAAILMKYNGLALALLPLFGVLLLRRFHLVKTRAFWAPAVLVLAIAGPWYFAVRRFVAYAAEPGEPFRRFLSGIANVSEIIGLAGPIVFVLAVAGAVWLLLRQDTEVAPEAEDPGVHRVSLAMALAVWSFHSLIYPIVEDRYLLPLAPCLILLAWIPLRVGAFYLLNMEWRMLHRRVPALRIFAVVALISPYAAFTFRVPRKQTSSYVEVARVIAAQNLPRGSAILVSSDAGAEGMLVAEMAMQEIRRPGHMVLRASKMLADRRMMTGYRLLYRTPGEVMEVLDAVPVALAVVENCEPVGCGEHARVLEESIATMPARWKLLHTVRRESGTSIRLFRIAGNEGKAVRDVRIDMRHTLGSVIEKAK